MHLSSLVLLFAVEQSMAKHKLTQWVLYLEELLVFHSSAPRTDTLGPDAVSSREGGCPPPQDTASSLGLTGS